jgi:hypothetical protein
MTQPRVDRDEIIRAARLLIVPEGITELRALDATLSGNRWPGIISGYFDSPGKLADTAASITSAKGIYVIPNEVSRELLARASNRIRKVSKSDPLTGDHDIARRRWLLIDVDPQRPAGISASDAERQAASDRANAIGFALHDEHGWPWPILADSGNGYHLLYRIDLPAEDGGLVQRCLAAMAARFDDDRVRVDTTVHNPARIWKLYGTPACKGDSTPDRPHRMARLLEVPAKVETVSESMLLILGGASEPSVNASAQPARMTSTFDLARWIGKHLPEATGPKPWKGGGALWTLPVCPWNADHTGDSAFIGQQPSGAIVAGCHHNSCTWGWRELRERFNPSAHLQGQHRRGEDEAVAKPIVVRLADVKPEPLRWLWPGRIALGKLTMIAGDPGLGKSFLTLDIAARVSTGTPWPDAVDQPNQAGGVVLLSAEDDIADTIRPRLDAAGAEASRIMALQAVRQGGDAGGQRMFNLATDLAALNDAIRACNGCRLVVVDPITAYLGKTDSHKNADIRGLLAPLSELASRHGIAIVAVSHLNKSGAGPAMYRTMGSLAFVAASRASWAVARDPDDHARRLLLPVKNNLAPDTGGLAYTLQAAASGGMPSIAWDAQPVSITADEVLSIQGGDDERTAREDAATWLRDALADGPVPADEVKRQAKANSISVRTLKRAKIDAGVIAKREGFGPGAKWYWMLPDHHRRPNVSIEGQPSDVAPYGEVGPVCDGDDDSEQGDAA